MFLPTDVKLILSIKLRIEIHSVQFNEYFTVTHALINNNILLNV